LVEVVLTFSRIASCSSVGAGREGDLSKAESGRFIYIYPFQCVLYRVQAYVNARRA
jgi:hypothetical protein